MDVKAFQAEKFVFGHYMRILKARSIIDNQPSKINHVPYSSRKQTIMIKYERNNNTKKLVDKLLQINDSHINSKGLRGKSSRKSTISTKNRKLTFSNNKLYQNNKKTLQNSYQLRCKQYQRYCENERLLWKMISAKPSYQAAFSEDREKTLSAYSSILKKPKRQSKMRDMNFQAYEQARLRSLVPSPSCKSKKSKKCKTLITTEATRPQTAR